MNVFAIANRVGGSGKTSTAVNLAAALGITRRVLLVDLDAKAHASIHLGHGPDHVTADVHDVLLGDLPATDAVIQTKTPGVWLLPGGPGSSTVEACLGDWPDPEFRLREVLFELEDFDDVIIDCPPSFGLLTLNALVAAWSVIVPWQASFLSLDGLVQEVQSVHWAVQEFNPGLRLEGVLPTRFESNSVVARRVMKVVEGYVEPGLLLSPIPADVAVAEAPCYAQPLVTVAPTAPATRAYVALALSLMERHAVGEARDYQTFCDLRAA